MRNKMIAVAVLAAVAMPMSALAGPGYNYVEAGYARVNLDDGPNLDGFALGGSFAVSDSFHVLAGYSNTRKSPLSFQETALALGYNLDLSGNADFVARVGWVNGRVRISGVGSASDDGWLAQVGFRNMMTNAFELNGFVTYVDAGGSETSLAIGGVYHFTDNVGLTGSVGISDDATRFGLGLRFSF